MICPRCRSVVVPLPQPSGELLCPACNNTGVVQWQPSPAAASPAGSVENAPGAVAALVFGVVSIIPWFGIVTGWVAIALGASALRTAKANPGRYVAVGLARAGLILGIIGLCIWVFALALWLVVLRFGAKWP